MSLEEAYVMWFVARQELSLAHKEVENCKTELETKLALAHAREVRAFRAVEAALVQEPPPGFRRIVQEEKK